ncbi:adenosine receptor a3 [Lynx pardinus]|uniref:Adenosine receptor a3 n=1 Tax=Lynx pardinus TaxID=191816 RepID=A0A485NGR7_LYNPA|nr:adenosine receptor a3 [Lynx pardinus]
MAVNSTALLLANVTYITVEILIGLCAIVGNVLVIWVVKLNPSLQTTTFYFIVSLALADIAVGVLVMPLAIVISLGITIHFYNCLFMTCLLLIFTHASIMSLLAIAVDRYLRVKLTVRIPETLGGILPFQVKVHFLPVMGLFILLLLTVFSDTLHFLLPSCLVARTTQEVGWENKRRKEILSKFILALCSAKRVVRNLKASAKMWGSVLSLSVDTRSQLIITLSCLTKEDTGWYPCGIQWDFARDDLDFTELVVTDDRGGLASDFWSGKDLSGDRHWSCRASNVAHKANPPVDMKSVCDSFRYVHSHNLHTDHRLGDTLYN